MDAISKITAVFLPMGKTKAFLGTMELWKMDFSGYKLTASLLSSDLEEEQF